MKLVILMSAHPGWREVTGYHRWFELTKFVITVLVVLPQSFSGTIASKIFLKRTRTGTRTFPLHYTLHVLNYQQYHSNVVICIFHIWFVVAIN